MTVMQCVVVGILVSGTTIVAPAVRFAPSAAAAQPREMSYEELMAEEPKQRPEIFCSLTPENQAALSSTHIARWRDANAHRLTEPQRALLAEWLELVTPAMYRRPKSSELNERLVFLEKRSAAIFQPGDLTNALTFDGPYVPAR